MKPTAKTDLKTITLFIFLLKYRQNRGIIIIMKMDKTQKLNGPVQFNKNIPSVCTHCKKVYKISKWYIEDGKRSGVTHGLCESCFEKLSSDLEGNPKEDGGPEK